MNRGDDVIGYGAVVLPHLDEFQGFFLVQNPTVDKLALTMQMNALRVDPTNLHGALQAAVVEGVVTKQWHVTTTAARALHGLTKEPFFWIKATKELGGTRTQMHVLEATDVEAAQREVNLLPEVLAIKERLLISIHKRKQ